MRRKAKGFTLIEIMVVIAIIAGLIGTVAIIVPQMQEKQKRFQCANNLSQLGGIFVAERTEKTGKPKYDGSALFLSWRVNGSKIKQGQESVLICPGDEGISAADTPEQRQRYDDVDLKSIPNDLCSYAVRDFSNFPLQAESKKQQLIACDRNGPQGKTMHHKNGLNMVFDDGSAVFQERESLGVASDVVIVVGPDATNEDLKQVIAVKHKD